MTQYKYPGQTVVGTYAYDADGHRTQKVESGTTTNYLFDGDRVQAEYDNSWALQAKYTLEGDSYYDSALSMRRSTATAYYMLDALGSVRKLTDSSQTATDSYSYEAFGALVATSGSTTNPYRYVGALGYYRDTTTGLLHLGARYADPAAGRFRSRDRVASGNRYVYARNAPIDRVDPSGLWESKCPGHGHDIGPEIRWIRNHLFDKLWDELYATNVDLVTLKEWISKEGNPPYVYCKDLGNLCGMMGRRSPNLDLHRDRAFNWSARGYPYTKGCHRLGCLLLHERAHGLGAAEELDDPIFEWITKQPECDWAPPGDGCY